MAVTLIFQPPEHCRVNIETDDIQFLGQILTYQDKIIF